MLERIKFGAECVSLRLYLHSLIEMIDAAVIFVSFAIDVYFVVTEVRRHHSASSPVEHGAFASTPGPDIPPDSTIKVLPEAAGFLVLFRLWRVVRIANAVLVSVSTTHETKIQELKEERDRAKRRVSQLEGYIRSLGGDIPSDSYPQSE
uniref:Voltage-gated hydrogen channel 1 n=1 Tax=Mesocestoides corti TaxID=53468 RepID=A0A5K3FAF4_MESCO